MYKDFADQVGELFDFDKEGNLLSTLIYIHLRWCTTATGMGMLCLSQHIRSSEGLEVQKIFPSKTNVLAVT